MSVWLNHSPVPYNTKRAEILLEELKITGAHTEILRSAFSHSDYLGRIARTDRAFIDEVFARPPEETLEQICQRVEAAGKQSDRELVMKILRQQKKRAAFLIALADITKLWQVEDVMRANTLFADFCLQASVRHLVEAEDEIKDKAGGGIFVLAMGKYGARELNYSSDIDIIVFYDAKACAKPDEAQKVYAKLVRSLVEMMQQTTADGYVFRTDLSLRPDPGTTQVAISIPAAHSYYESLGQNWERAAFIKARLAAGDAELGKIFLDEMEPFIWRKYLDYAVLQDIHAMKRQTHAAIGWDETMESLEGRDIKRAAGGIRDIEMFVQSQQLIAGGRDKLLRRRKTCEMLARLVVRKWITKETAQELIEAYRFFRMVEHRLQMIADEQTHKLPNSQDNWQQLALFCNFDDIKTFQAKLYKELDLVRGHYGELFKQAPTLTAQEGALVFTGGEDDPETLHTLEVMGFRDGGFITKTIRSWHRGRIPAAASAHARELLTELIPKFLGVLSKATDPQAAFNRLDRFLSSLKSAVQFFSLLQSNPHLIALIALICDTAPRLADDLAKNSRMIEALFSSMPDDRMNDLEMLLSHAQNYEDVLNDVRLWVAEQQFHIAIKVLNNHTGGMAAAEQFSTIAEAAVVSLQKRAREEFNKNKKAIPPGEIAVLAAGSLGAREMTIISDLDMIFIYDGPETKESNKIYWIHLAQSIFQALTVQTSKGGLYDVDMRLRPSGKAGPVAISLDAFENYQNDKAWVWEHMALTRMRPLTGSQPLRAKITKIIQEVLTKPRDEQELKKEVLEMRARISQARQPKGAWDISATAGGLVDAEFICQFMQLLHGAKYPEILSHSTIEAFTKITAAGVADLSPLKEAESFFKKMVQLLNLSVGRIGDDEAIPLSLRAALIKSASVEDWAALKILRDKHYQAVERCFSSLIGKKS